MIKVGSREFKNHFGRYMRAVREGKTLIITVRGEAVARIYPLEPAPSRANLPRK
jgi:prevent-host-death family protein